MRARIDGAGAIVPGEPSWSLSPSFQPPEYIRGASRINPFPELSLEDPGSEPFTDGPPPAAPFPVGALLIALGAFALLAGTIALLWIERLRRKAEESPDSAG